MSGTSFGGRGSASVWGPNGRGGPGWLGTRRSRERVLDVTPRREYYLSHCDQRSVRLSLLLSGECLELPRSRIIAIANRTLIGRTRRDFQGPEALACRAFFVRRATLLGSPERSRMSQLLPLFVNLAGR